MSVKDALLTALAGILALFAFAGAAGGTWVLLFDETQGGRASWAAAILIAVLLMIGGAALYGLRLLKPWAVLGEPTSPKTRKARNLLLASGALGGLLGAALAISTITMDQPFALFSNSPLPVTIVIPVLAVWLLLVPLISWQWHRSVDEHEIAAYRFGGVAGLYLYAFLTPAWWLAWRGGLVPAPETMLIYLIVIGVWSAGWFWRKWRA